MAQKYTDDEILEALLAAGSARQAAKRMGCSPPAFTLQSKDETRHIPVFV